jgi:predicted ArsR family transcriptional regulator
MSDMSDIQEQARAMGDPTRHAMFRHIAESASPVTVNELTERFGLNHNAVRQHLAKLVAARLVIEGRAAPSGPGRPRLVYSVDPAAEGRWGTTGPYERLAKLLTEIIRSGDTPVEVGRRAGKEDATARAHGDPLAAWMEIVARNGFQPTVEQHGDEVEVMLHACPFANAALADPDIVCELHRGIALGVVEAIGGITIDGLERNDPRRAPCRFRAHVDDDDRG